MSYDKKLCDEQHMYGKVTCKVCKKRTVVGWNIYKNNICSHECSQKMIEKLLSNPELQKKLAS